MSIQITHGSATVSLDSLDRKLFSREGATVSYEPTDLLDATAAALRAVNTPRAIACADVLFRLVSGQFPIGYSLPPTPLEGT